MYASHFHLRGEPFSLTPDPAFLYLGPGHAEALAAIKVGLEGRRGIMVMVGEVGMGKTTILYSLLSELGDGIKTAYISNTTLPFDDILRQALADFGVPCASRDRVKLLAALNAFLRRCAHEGNTAALVIDEAQNLEDDAFENLRLLSNYETYTEKLLQIVLVGQPELEAKLRQAKLRQVAERVAVRCNINPLSRSESLQYVEHRLRRVGGSITGLFTKPALDLLVRKARGIPRRLNILCHTAMLFAYGRGEGCVTASMMRAAVREKEGRGLVTVGRGLRGRLTGPRIATWIPRLRFRPLWAAAGFLVGMMAIIGLVRLDSRSESSETTAVAIDVPTASASDVHGTADGRPNPAIDHDAAAIALRQANSDTAPVPGSPAAVAPGAAANEPDAARDQPLAVSDQAAGDAPTPATIEAAARTAPLDAPTAPAAVELAVAPTGPSYREVRVRRGENLQRLVRDIYGESHPDLIDRVRAANPRIVNPDHIMAGDILRFPEPNGAQRP